MLHASPSHRANRRNLSAIHLRESSPSVTPSATMLSLLTRLRIPKLCILINRAFICPLYLVLERPLPFGGRFYFLLPISVPFHARWLNIPLSPSLGFSTRFYRQIHALTTMLFQRFCSVKTSNVRISISLQSIYSLRELTNYLTFMKYVSMRLRYDCDHMKFQPYFLIVIRILFCYITVLLYYCIIWFFEYAKEFNAIHISYSLFIVLIFRMWFFNNIFSKNLKILTYIF